MTRRGAAKASGRSVVGDARPAHAKASGGRSKPSAANGSLEERLALAERERDDLRAELERFKARQRQLEEAQAHVCDRIAWALDSLHNILDGKA